MEFCDVFVLVGVHRSPFSVYVCNYRKFMKIDDRLDNLERIIEELGLWMRDLKRESLNHL